MTAQKQPNPTVEILQQLHVNSEESWELIRRLVVRTEGGFEALKAVDKDLAAMPELRFAGDGPRAALPFPRPGSDTGVRRGDGSDDAAALLAADPDPPVILTGPAVRCLRAYLQEIREVLAPQAVRRSVIGGAREAIRTAIAASVACRAVLDDAKPAPSTPQGDTP
jgi:hypothetical protein